MMADVSGFSRLMGSNEDGTVDLIRDFHDRVRRHVEECEGRVVDTAGDSVFGEFDSVIHAIECAQRIQEDQARINGAQPEQPIEMRIGVHLGDVIVEDYNVYGDGVNIAARLESLADPGGIAISEAVYQQVRGKLDLPVRDLGLQELKNIQHPVHVYEVSPPASHATPAAPPPAPLVEAAPASVSQARAEARPTKRASRRRPASWGEAMTEPAVLIPTILGGFLLLSPLFLFSTAGVFPTGGAVLLASTLGPVWARQQNRRGATTLALGAAIASGALFTNWSGVTNSLFLLGGLIVAATGVRRRRSPQ